MYMNPTVQLHSAYELIEHLLELNTKTPRKLGDQAAKDEKGVKLLSKQAKLDKIEKKKTQVKLVDIFKKQRENQMTLLKSNKDSKGVKSPAIVRPKLKVETKIDEAASIIEESQDKFKQIEEEQKIEDGSDEEEKIAEDE